jgi:hypothetical protein
MKDRVALPHSPCKLYKFAGNTPRYVGVPYLPSRFRLVSFSNWTLVVIDTFSAKCRKAQLQLRRPSLAVDVSRQARRVVPLAHDRAFRQAQDTRVTRLQS